MAVEIRAATYAALRTALSAGTYQAGQFVFVEAGTGGNNDVAAWGIVEYDGAGGYVDIPPRIVASADGRWRWRQTAGISVTSTRSLIANSDDLLDSSVSTATLITPSNPLFKSGIGEQSVPSGTTAPDSHSNPSATPDAEHGVPWSADSSYPTGVGTAYVATLIGGYDHRVNQIAGTAVGGGHNYMQYNVNGHSTIIGGSSNRIDSGRATIVGGSGATISGSLNIYSAIVGGNLGLVSGTSRSSAILAGDDSRIINSQYSATVAGDNSRISGANYSSIIGGLDNLVNGSYYATVLGGRDADVLPGGGYWYGAGKIVESGDAQIFDFSWKGRTTSASVINLLGPQGYIAMGSSHTTVVSGRYSIVALDEATGSTAAFNYEGSVSWDGTTELILDGLGSGTSRDFSQIHDAIGVSAVPKLVANTGSIRPQVYGKAATNIKWVARFTGCITRFANP